LLIETLREQLGLTGTKLGCGTGDCGACTVVVDGEAVCACLLFSAQCQHLDITTVEGLAETSVGRAVGEALRTHGGVQCGICTPGIMASSCALIEALGAPDRDQVKRSLAGNICRCTGYNAIVDAICSAGESLLKAEQL